jgi:hypothetical protein
MSEWKIRTWTREHKTHGVFFVGDLADGRASAQRVYGPANPRHQVEDLGGRDGFANFALAMMACEKRIAELDQLMLDETIADLRAYTSRVSGA